MSVSKSALCADFINWAMIGGVHSRSIYATYYKLAKIFETSIMELPISYTALAVFDNNSNDYKGTTWRSGKNQKKSQLVWCNVGAYIYKKEEDEDEHKEDFDLNLCNQMKYEHRPANWANSKKTLHAANIQNITQFGNNNIPNRTSVHPNDTLTDVEYVKKEVCESILYAIALFADLPQLKAYVIREEDKQKYGKTTYKDITVECNATEITAKNIEKICLYCSKINYKSASICRFCLSDPLRSIADIRQQVLGASKELLFKPSPPRINNRTKTRISSLDNNNKINYYDMDVSSDSFSVPLLDEEEVHSTKSYIKILRQLLPSIMLNPSSASNVKEIYGIIGKRFNLIGFADPSSSTNHLLLRYYLYLVSDYGATNLELIDSDPNFLNFIHVVGTFHECKSFLEITMDLLFSIGGNELAILHTYVSEKAQAYLRRCGDLHKANDFLRDVVKPALHVCIILEYMNTQTDLDFNDISIDEVIEWMNNIPENDLRYKNFIFYINHILPCYELIKKGVRTGNMEGYNAGRRGLLPFMFALSKTNYGPLLIRDMIQYYWRAPDAVRIELNEIFGLYDEGINGKMEESNKDQKSNTLGDSRLGIQAGALLTDTSVLLRDAMLKLKGDKTTDTSKDIPERRTPTDLNEDIIDCVRYLMEHRVFAKELSNPTSPTKFNSEPLKEGGYSLVELYDEGVVLADKYYQSYINSDNLNLPKCSRHKTFKLLKKRKNAITLEDEEFSEDDHDLAANTLPIV